MDRVFNKIIGNFNFAKKTKLKVGTDCSGIEAPLMALDIMHIPYEHIFSSEIDKNCIDFIRRNFKSHIYRDLRNRNNKGIPRLDLYIAGFPCQTFSSLGRNEGFNNATKGTIFFYIYDFIKTNNPKVFILENVKTLLTHDKGRTFKIIISLLELLNYNVSYKIMNTYDYGIPQSRNRVYIVGVHQSEKKQFEFPRETGPIIKLNQVLETCFERQPLSGRQIERYREVKNKYRDIDFDSEMWILNLDVSSIKWFRLGHKGVSPCIITGSKYYITSKSRYLNGIEALRLQGIPWRLYDFTGFNERMIIKFAGNTMSVNILCALYKSLYE